MRPTRDPSKAELDEQLKRDTAEFELRKGKVSTQPIQQANTELPPFTINGGVRNPRPIKQQWKENRVRNG